LHDETYQLHTEVGLQKAMPAVWPEKEDHELLALVQEGSGPAFALPPSAFKQRQKDNRQQAGKKTNSPDRLFSSDSYC
jgi:hypothetical protein